MDAQNLTISTSAVASRSNGLSVVSIPIPGFLISFVGSLWFYFRLIVTKVPGGTYALNYMNKIIRDDPYRAAIEFSLILYGIYYYLSKPQQKRSLGGQSKLSMLSKQEIDNLIEEWEPEPLVEPIAANTCEWRLEKIPEIQDGGARNYITIKRGTGENTETFTNVFNLVSNNFLKLSETDDVKEIAKQTIKRYGVGACGPAGFYGNQDVHYNLEYMLASFFGTEGAALYGQDFCVAPSVIPAFTKRGDIIVADDQVSISLQNALQLSRSTVYYFQHNNMDSLDELLTNLNDIERREKPPAIPRKFIVTEGLFHNLGDIAPLPRLVELKRKHKFRLFVDETFSLGVLGKTGRGLAEHFNMDRSEAIDITVGSMATALGSSGGFALGDQIMTNHQRIGSHAYTFSASLPAYTITVAARTLQILDRDNSRVTQLHKLSAAMHDFFLNGNGNDILPFIVVSSTRDSPVLHLHLGDSYRKRKFGYTRDELFQRITELQKKRTTDKFLAPYEAEEKFLQSIVDDILTRHNILISRNTFVLKQETLPIVPSLKISCNADMTESELLEACSKIRESLVRLCA